MSHISDIRQLIDDYVSPWSRNPVALDKILAEIDRAGIGIEVSFTSGGVGLETSPIVFGHAAHIATAILLS